MNNSMIMKQTYMQMASPFWRKAPGIFLKPAFTLLVFVLWGGGIVLGQPVADPTVSSNFATSGTTVTVSHTTGANDNRLMLVGVTTRDRTVTSVTWGEDALELVGSEASNTDAVTYIYKLVSPSSGTDNVVVTFAGGNLGNDRAGIVGVMTYYNVDQNTPHGTYTSSSGNDASPSLTISPTNTNQIVYNVLAVTDAATITLNSSQTQQWLITGYRPVGGGYTKTASSPSTTLSYSLSTARRWSLSGVAINPVPIADLQITKTVNNPTPYVGQTITFTLTATNAGPGIAHNVVVNDLLPAGYTYISHSTATGTYTGGTGVWDIGTLNTSTSATLTINAVVNASGSYSNSAAISGDVVDNTSGNNSATVSITPCQAGGTAPLFNN